LLANHPGFIEPVTDRSRSPRPRETNKSIQGIRHRGVLQVQTIWYEGVAI
ncbi:hypothetical protein SeMB42_g07701, partial [Synchytrium endobioticum]